MNRSVPAAIPEPVLAPNQPVAHLQELQHFAELGRLSASLLHEISNPLTAALLHLELSDQQTPAIREARRDMQLLKRYVEAARQQARLASKSTNFSVPPQLNQLKRVLLPLAKQARVRLDIEMAPPIKLYGDPVKFQHLVANLIVNAIQAYASGEPYDPAALVRLTVQCSEDWLTIQVTDWGKGIAASELAHIFEPFYTTKDKTSHGLGIGLAIVNQYVTEDFYGSIKVSSSRRLGTQFTVKLRRLAS